MQVSKRQSTYNRGKTHIGGVAHARQRKCMHGREKESTHTRLGKHTCGGKAQEKKALDRR